MNIYDYPQLITGIVITLTLKIFYSLSPKLRTIKLILSIDLGVV